MTVRPQVAGSAKRASTKPSHRCTLHLRASRRYEQQGHTAEAVQHALSAHVWQRAADLIESFTQAPAGKTCEVPTIVHWLEQLPTEIVKRHMGNILSKLQARNRTQAVAQARTIGLLADEPEVGSVFLGGVTI